MRGKENIKCTILFLKYLYYTFTLNFPTCFGPQWIIIRESNQSNTAKKRNTNIHEQGPRYTSHKHICKTWLHVKRYQTLQTFTTPVFLSSLWLSQFCQRHRITRSAWHIAAGRVFVTILGMGPYLFTLPWTKHMDIWCTDRLPVFLWF